MKIVLDTLGCKLNQAETESLARRLVEAGHTIVDTIDEAELFILNTCTVTAAADAKSRQLLRKARRRNPEIQMIAVGCYPQRDPEAFARIEGLILSAVNDDKMMLAEFLPELGFPGNPGNLQPGAPAENTTLSRTRSFLKIQDGCSNFCTYCIVPFVRGAEKSVPADNIIGEINDRVADGIQEVVLTGTEIGSYNDNGLSLHGLLKKTLSETGIARIRLSSLQPDEITPELISLWADERLCPHFHLSLQSGSDSVLRRMGRRYGTTDYRQAVSLIRGKLPDAAITTDIITGFPGEMEREYVETLDMCREMQFARIHVFPYSRRPGTAAAAMPNRVPDSIKTQRNRNLGALSKEYAETFRQRFSGRNLDVLWEKQTGGVWSGYTPNYIRVYAVSEGSLANRIVQAKLIRPHKDGMRGETIQNT